MKTHKVQPSPHPLLDESSITKIQNQLQLQNVKHRPDRVSQVEIDILQSLSIKYKLNQIPLNQDEFLHTIFITCENSKQKNKNFYMTHGFGGTSLMYFPIIKFMLQYGNVILWEIRGMGYSKKLDKYNVTLEQTQKFFIYPFDVMLKYYNHDQIYFISHSFGGYLTLLYNIKYKTFGSRIKQVILLSPVGITPKEEDYKSQVKNFSDVIHSIGNLISWKFHLTYKSPFRGICSCMKEKVFKGAVQDCEFNLQEKVLMKNLLIGMVEYKDGSQNVFFNYFQPRVLPKFPLQPLFSNQPDIKINIIYGGQQDWVDKKGAQRVRDKYPNKITLKQVKQCGHNFPFFPVQLKNVLQQILSPNVTKHKQPVLTQIKSDYQDKSTKKQASCFNNYTINSQQKQNSDDAFGVSNNCNNDQIIENHQKKEL